MKNAAHLAVLAVWAVAGVVFSLKVLFAGGAGALAVLSFWAWFAGFAALMSWLVGKVQGPLPAVGMHAAAFFVMHLIPKVLPFSIVRLGLDLLTGNA